MILWKLNQVINAKDNCNLKKKLYINITNLTNNQF